MAAGCPCAHPLLGPAIPNSFWRGLSRLACSGGAASLRGATAALAPGRCLLETSRPLQPPHNSSRAPSVYFLQTCAAQNWRQWPLQRCCWAALPWPPTATTVSTIFAALCTPTADCVCDPTTPVCTANSLRPSMAQAACQRSCIQGLRSSPSPPTSTFHAPSLAGCPSSCDPKLGCMCASSKAPGGYSNGDTPQVRPFALKVALSAKMSFCHLITTLYVLSHPPPHLRSCSLLC